MTFSNGDVVSLHTVGSEKRRKCAFPTWLNYHHDWHSIEGNTSIHVNSGHSLKLDGGGGGFGAQSHVTCHAETAVDSATTRVVTHIKSGWYVPTTNATVTPTH